MFALDGRAAVETTPAVPVLVAGTLGGVTTAVLRRMVEEYDRTDTLSATTVTAMYGAYAAHAGALAWGARRRVWPVPLPAVAARGAGGALAVAGSAIALAGAAPFGAGAQISGMTPGSMHAAGIYRYSRNPQYLGLVLAAAGVAVAARSGFAALGAAGVWLAYRSWIPSEEAHLTRVFGDRYADYRARVPRWLGCPSRNR